MSSAIDDAWAALEREIERHRGAAPSHLRGPADPAALRTAQRALAIPWPDAVLRSLCRHDGEHVLGGLLVSWRLLPASEIPPACAQVALFAPTSLAAGVLPIAEDGASNYQCVVAAEQGELRLGQVVTLYHDALGYQVTAESLDAHLDGVSAGLRSGAYEIDPKGRVRKARRR